MNRTLIHNTGRAQLARKVTPRLFEPLEKCNTFPSCLKCGEFGQFSKAMLGLCYKCFQTIGSKDVSLSWSMDAHTEPKPSGISPKESDAARHERAMSARCPRCGAILVEAEAVPLVCRNCGWPNG